MAQIASTTGTGNESPRIASLARRHAALEARLTELGASAYVDEAEIKRVKRAKLHLKDQLAKDQLVKDRPARH